MSETAPNSKGPAKVQMTPEQAASLGLTPAPEATTPAEPTLIPVSEVKPEEVARLGLRLNVGEMQLEVHCGSFVPELIMVVDRSGNAVAEYTVGPVSARDASSEPRVYDAGIINPTACDPTLSDGGIVDHGKLTAKDL
ncbi:DUF1120 domain-containing protein [Embleya sp. NPDC059259]|uniref:DUF1120 domain-containing protein n=1 Tax=unclassified Embleya TaxID=2699296 RepID=UPI0036AED8E9